MSDKISPETENKLALFDQADKVFQTALAQFERTYETALDFIEKLREDRNAKLDDAKRALRADTELLQDFRATFEVGPFKIQKKWSDFYIPEKLIAMLADAGLYDSALSAKIIAIRTEVAKYEQVQKFLEDNGVLKEFECCEDGEESNIAITGPRSVPPLGAELKKE